MYCRWTFYHNYTYKHQTRDVLASMLLDGPIHVSKHYQLHHTVQRAATFTAAQVEAIEDTDLITMITKRHWRYWGWDEDARKVITTLLQRRFEKWEDQPHTGQWFVDPVWRTAIAKVLPNLGPIPDGPPPGISDEKNEDPALEHDLESPGAQPPAPLLTAWAPVAPLLTAPVAPRKRLSVFEILTS